MRIFAKFLGIIALAAFIMAGMTSCRGDRSGGGNQVAQEAVAPAVEAATTVEVVPAPGVVAVPATVGGQMPEAPEADFTVTLTSHNAGVIIVRYNGNAATVRIPTTIQGMPVREIGASAFTRNTTITRVVVPEGVTTIRSVDGSDDGRGGGGFWTSGAFAGASNLTSVTLPSSLQTIGIRAFAACTALREIVIPEGVTEIGDHAFAGCRSLASVTLPSTLTRLGRSAFSLT